MKFLRGIIKLALVNLVLSLIDIDNVLSVIRFTGFRVNFIFTLPTVIPTLWDLMGMDPVTSIYVNLNPGTIPSLAYAFIAALLQYFYIYYMIKRIIKPTINIKGGRIIDILLFNIALLFAVLLVIIIYLTTRSVPLFTAILILYLIGYYFVYGAPYVIVLKDLEFRRALNLAIRIAMNGEYLLFTIIYGLITFFTSPIISAIAYGGKLIGIVVASLIAALVGLWLSASTLIMINYLINVKPH
ncbi:MAG: hypothetical protein ACP5GY_09525 [Vulcanisaeta sp.]